MSTKIKTKDIKPREGEMVKPAEIIGIDGFEYWKLSDRRIWNQLLMNAWDGDRLEDPAAVFTIQCRNLRGSQDKNFRLRDSILRLQKTVVFARLKDGTITQVQLLGGTNYDDDENDIDVLRYNFNPMLVPILRDSEIYARMQTKVLTSMTSKYSLALYEEIALRIGLDRNSDKISMSRLRQILSVPEGRLMRWPDLQRKAVQPAVTEVNALSPYEVSIEPIKTGKAFTDVQLKWRKKIPGSPAEQAAAREVNNHKAGRRARITGNVEEIAPRSFATKKAAADILQRQGINWREWEETHEAWRQEVCKYPVTPADLDAHFISYAVKKNGGHSKNRPQK